MKTVLSRTRTRTGLAATATAMLAIASIAGCSSTSGSSDAPVELRVQFEQGGTNAEMYEALVAGFEATHKNVTVKLESVTNEAKNGTNLTVLSSANAPDVGLLPTNSPAFESMVSTDSLVDLADVWENQDLDTRYPPSLQSMTEYEGKHYVLSLSPVYYSFIYYNIDLFEQNGIEVPADHRIASASELYSIVDALREGGSEPLALAGKSTYMSSWMVDALLPTSADESDLENYLTSSDPAVPVTAEFSDPAFVDTLEALSDYNAHGVYQTGFLGMDPAATEAMFKSGTVGMLVGGSWQASILRDADLPFEFGFLFLPPVNPGATAQLSGYYAAEVVIPKNASQIELAKEFLEYMVSDEGQAKAVVQAGGLIPSVNTVPTSELEKLDPLVQELQADVNEHGAQSGYTSTVPAAIGQATLDPLVQTMYSGGITPQAIGDTIQEALEAARAEG